jgi:hypothetical protein
LSIQLALLRGKFRFTLSSLRLDVQTYSTDCRGLGLSSLLSGHQVAGAAAEFLLLALQLGGEGIELGGGGIALSEPPLPSVIQPADLFAEPEALIG